MRQVVFVGQFGNTMTTDIDFEPHIGDSVIVPAGVCKITDVIWDLDGRVVVHLGEGSRR